jgi:hypothetical protein
MVWALNLNGIDNFAKINEVTIPAGEDFTLRFVGKLDGLTGDAQLGMTGTFSNFVRIYSLKGAVYNQPDRHKTDFNFSGTSSDLEYITAPETIDNYDYELQRRGGVVDLVDTATQVSLVKSTTINDNAFEFNQLFKYANGSGYLGGNQQLIQLTSVSANHKWDANVSDHDVIGVQPILVDTISGNDAAGNNFTANGSDWVSSGENTPEIYSFSSTINQQTQFSSAKNKTVSVNALLAQTQQAQALTNKSINYAVNINQVVNLNSAANKSANLNSVIAQNYQNQATSNKQTNANGAITQTVLLTGYFNNSTIEIHQFSANITINPTISAAVTKQNLLNGEVEQAQTITATATKAATLQSNCFYQVTLNAQSTKQTNINGLINQAVILNALLINTAAPIHLRLFRIDGQIAFQRFNGAIITQRFNGALK